jgi:hypothetical protein
MTMSRARLGRHGEEVVPVELDFTGTPGAEAEHGLQQRGFSCAVRTDEAHEFA